MAVKAPLRAVVEVMEVEGPRGGIIHALILSCGCFVTRRLGDKAPPEEVPCIACLVGKRVAILREIQRRRTVP